MIHLCANRNTFHVIQHWLHRIHRAQTHRTIHKTDGLADNGKDEPCSNYYVSSIQSPCASILPLHNAPFLHYAHEY